MGPCEGPGRGSIPRGDTVSLVQRPSHGTGSVTSSQPTQRKTWPRKRAREPTEQVPCYENWQPCPTFAAYKPLMVQHHVDNVEKPVRLRNLDAARTCMGAFCVHDVVAACHLAMVDGGVRIPLDALGTAPNGRSLQTVEHRSVGTEGSGFDSQSPPSPASPDRWG
jgi:hypothetical protein